MSTMLDLGWLQPGSFCCFFSRGRGRGRGCYSLQLKGQESELEHGSSHGLLEELHGPSFRGPPPYSTPFNPKP